MAQDHAIAELATTERALKRAKEELVSLFTNKNL